MKLYHYSKEKYPILKSKSLVDGEEKGDLVSYKNHISFFFEPPPLDIIGDIFGPGHHTWAPGTKLIEHTVDTNNFGDFFYRLVESPEKTAMIYDDGLSVEAYHKKLKQINEIFRYEGTTVEDLEFACKRLKGTVRKFYELLPTRTDFLNIKDKYAATVPHLMIYFEDRCVKISSTKQVQVKDNRKLKQESRGYTMW